MSSLIDLTGKNFGSWTILKRSGADCFGKALWVHKVINRMRGSLTDEEFILWCNEKQMNINACGREDHTLLCGFHGGHFCQCDHCGINANQLTYLSTGVDCNGMCIYAKLCPACLDVYNKKDKEIHIHIHIHPPMPQWPLCPIPFMYGPTIVERPSIHGTPIWWGETICQSPQISSFSIPLVKAPSWHYSNEAIAFA